MSDTSRWFKKQVARVIARPMQWSDEYALGSVKNKKEENYRLAQDGLLTEGKKQEILTAICKRKLRYDPNWDEPKTFNEKIMWLKLHYQNPDIIRCIDKFSVKGYVTEVLGPEFVVPTIGWWRDPDEIDFDALPDRFALKVNWSSGMNIIVKDKSQLDVEDTKRKLRGWMRPEQNSYYQMFNWGYKYMTPVVYAEEYISEAGDSSQIYDYKFYCYDGTCKNLFITTDRFTHKTYNWFDRDFNELPFTYSDKAGKTEGGVKKPKHFEEMIGWAEKLARPFPFVRVDFYEIGDRVMVGEMTFYSGGGILAFHPRTWDYEIGKLIHLPEPMYFHGPEGCEALAPKDAWAQEQRITDGERRRFAERKYYANLFAWPDLAAPKTYSEKLLRLALDRGEPRAAMLFDRAEVKKYVAETVGEQYAVPTIGVYEDVDGIDWDALPEGFAARSTDSRDGRRTEQVLHRRYRNEGRFKADAAAWLCPWNTFYYENMCLTGGPITPRILIEELLEGPVTDWRLLCLEGEPVVLTGGRSAGALIGPPRWLKELNAAQAPARLEEMTALARELAVGFHAVRVDFMENQDRLYVGGLCAFPWLNERIDPETDRRLGRLLRPEDIGGTENG